MAQKAGVPYKEHSDPRSSDEAREASLPSPVETVVPGLPAPPTPAATE